MATTYFSWLGSVCAITLLFCIIQAAPQGDIQQWFVGEELTADALSTKLAHIQRQFAKLKEQITANNIYNKNNANDDDIMPAETKSVSLIVESPHRGVSFNGNTVRDRAEDGFDREQMVQQLFLQSVKRSLQDYSRENEILVIRAIERQLADILQAGERLGIGADDILQHLRRRNAQPIF